MYIIKGIKNFIIVLMCEVIKHQVDFQNTQESEAEKTLNPVLSFLVVLMSAEDMKYNIIRKINSIPASNGGKNSESPFNNL